MNVDMSYVHSSAGSVVTCWLCVIPRSCSNKGGVGADFGKLPRTDGDGEPLDFSVNTRLLFFFYIEEFT